MSSGRDETIGLALEELETPALLLDRELCLANLERMAAYFRDRPAKLRPHFKNHKCTQLARLQLEAGAAVGLTCAKLFEAECAAAAGIDDLLIANQVVGPRKVARLAALARSVRLRVAVDDLEQARELSRAAVAAGATLGVLVEVDIGMGRCGVAPGAAALELALALAELPGLQFDGIQAFEGHLVYEPDRELRARRTRESMALAIDTRRMIEAEGLEVEILSGGSSATYDVSGALEGVDEIQAGSYATMDWRYHELVPEFAIALSVLARVISRRDDAVVVDAGVKGAGGEFGPPRVLGAPEVEVPFFLSEEHLVLKNPPSLSVGDTVRLLPSHACTTCNLYRRIHVHSGGRVVDVWPIEASGRPE